MDIGLVKKPVRETGARASTNNNNFFRGAESDTRATHT